jgi:hypothetical protein
MHTLTLLASGDDDDNDNATRGIFHEKNMMTKGPLSTKQ